MIHFLRLNLPLLQGELLRGARLAKTTLIQYVHQNESLIFECNSNSIADIAHGEAFDIFQPGEPVMLSRKEKSILSTHKSPNDGMGKRENVVTIIDDRSTSEPPSKRHSSGITATNGVNLNGNNIALLHVQQPPSRHHLVGSHYLSHLPLRRTLVEDIATPSGSLSSSAAPQFFHTPHHNPTINNNRTPNSASINTEHYLERIHSLNDLYEKEMMVNNNRPLSHPIHPIALHRPVNEEVIAGDLDDEWQNVHSVSKLF